MIRSSNRAVRLACREEWAGNRNGRQVFTRRPLFNTILYLLPEPKNPHPASPPFNKDEPPPPPPTPEELELEREMEKCACR